MTKINKIGSKLSKFEKKHGFNVPENYFDELPLKIQAHISLEKSHTPILIPIFKQKIRVVYTFSFLIILFLLIGSYFYFNTYSIKQITVEDLIEYTIYSDDELDEFSLIGEMSGTSSTENNENSNEIIDYLVTENIDYTTILEEF